MKKRVKTGMKVYIGILCIGFCFNCMLLIAFIAGLADGALSVGKFFLFTALWAVSSVSTLALVAELGLKHPEAGDEDDEA